MIKYISQQKLKGIRRRLRRLYGGEQAERLIERFYHMLGRYGVGAQPASRATVGLWDQKDAILITYADNIRSDGEMPLKTLHAFCNESLKGVINTVHLLPFYPWTSDDGFSVVDYREVDPRYGRWKDVEAMAADFRLMFDFVLNHCSSENAWFRDLLAGISPGRDYFLCMDPETDLSAVVRPRTSPLLTKKFTRHGESWLWTTFSEDQVDLNWQNPDLLFEFIDILFWYLSKGARLLRLDAVAFLWKQPGTNCLHLQQTHEVVKLMRDICDVVAPDTLIITETNVPHEENISYFGSGDEAHMVYNFSLPPMLLHGLLNQTPRHIAEWAANLAYPGNGRTFLNFTASHDGIGMRPLQGLLPEDEIKRLADHVTRQGGHVSMKRNSDGSESPYELNITYFSALDDPTDARLGVERFLCSQAVALALRGVPAVYIHSLTATPNYTQGVGETGRARTVNRRKYELGELQAILADKASPQAEVFQRYTRMLRRRANYAAFHPDAGQKVYQVDDALLVIERIPKDREQSLLCIFNFTADNQIFQPAESARTLPPGGKFHDIIAGKNLSIPKKGLSLQPYQAVWLVRRAD